MEIVDSERQIINEAMDRCGRPGVNATLVIRAKLVLRESGGAGIQFVDGLFQYVG
jgi:hypothetical protein